MDRARCRRASSRPSHVEDAARKRPLRYDRAGDRHYDLASALIKSMRGSDPDAAVYYLAAMLEGGEDPRFLARRIVIAASEDVGDADPQALVVAVAAAQAVEHVGLPEAQLDARPGRDLRRACAEVERPSPARSGRHGPTCVARGSRRRRPCLRDAHYRGAAERGHGGYVSPHDDPERSAVDHLPERLQGRTYYRPSTTGGPTTQEAGHDDTDR